MKNIAGLKYGMLLIIEDKGEKDPSRNASVVVTQCVCGHIKVLPKAPFIAGSNPEKCFKCHLRIQKNKLMATKRRF